MGVFLAGNHHGTGLSRGNSRMAVSRGKTNKKVAGIILVLVN